MTESGRPTGEDPRIGRVVAEKYRIEAVVGSGATGVVYRAQHLRLERPIALKVMDARLMDKPDAQARFRREARAASRLEHPHSVQVFDFGIEPDGLTYLAMELLDGRELYRVIYDDWPLSVERIVRMMTELLSVLAAAHEAGIVHRDLKPENVMLVVRAGADGPKTEMVKVTDFGIAKSMAGEATEESLNLTRDGAVHGTPEYMAPEQARGEELDGRADLYACGVILYEMLTGTLPFTGDGAFEVILKQLTETAPSLASRRAGVDLRLEPVIQRALSKKREDRFADAHAMMAAIVTAASAPPRTEPLPQVAVLRPGGPPSDPLSPTADERVDPAWIARHAAAIAPESRAPGAAVVPRGSRLRAPISGRWWLVPVAVLGSMAVGVGYVTHRLVHHVENVARGSDPVRSVPDANVPRMPVADDPHDASPDVAALHAVPHGPPVHHARAVRRRRRP